MSMRVSKALFAVLAAWVLLLGGSPSPVQAQERVIRVLGGSTRFSAPVRSVGALQKMAQANRADFVTVLNDADLQPIRDQVIDIMVNGRVTETTVAPGTHLEWMALRRDRKPNIVRDVRWGGPKPFQAFQFSVESGNSTYNFVVPFDCGNLSLVSVATKAAPPPPPPPPPPQIGRSSGWEKV